MERDLCCHKLFLSPTCVGGLLRKFSCLRSHVTRQREALPQRKLEQAATYMPETAWHQGKSPEEHKKISF